MEVDIRVIKINEVLIKVEADEGITKELSEYLTFWANNYKWNPKFRSKIWDGKIRLLSYRRTCYGGLLSRIEKWALERDYSFQDDTGDYQNEFSVREAEQFVLSLNLPIQPRDYQMKYFINTIRKKKIINLSPTSSGKSLLAYLIIRWLLKNEPDNKILLTVPTIALTSQMISDFEDYGWKDARKFCHQVYGGIEKDSTKPVIITTWQSIFTKPEMWFHQYTAIIGDEAHECEAKSLVYILKSTINASYRIGLTGTLNDAKISKFTLEGLFGPIYQVVTTKELIDNGTLAKFQIKALVLKHNTKGMKNMDYFKEIEYLVGHKNRNEYISNLAVSLKNNTLILYRYVDKHGKVLKDMISEKLKGSNRNVYYIDGSTDIDIREEIRGILEKETDAILIASTGTFSRGSNVKNLSNLIIAFPNKAKVRLLQSIGRALRPLPGKEAVLYDIADDLETNVYKNITMNHFKERLKIYATEKFDYKLYKIQLKE